MPEIVIRQTLNDAQFKKGISENAENIRQWGKEAQRVFNETRTPMERYEQEVSRLEKLHRDGYIAAETYNRAVAAAAAKAAGPAQGGAGQGANLMAAGQQVAGLGGGVGSGLFTALSNPIVGMTAAAIAGVAAISRLGEEMHQLDMQAKNVGVSLHTFQEMKVAAEITGVGVEQMASAMERLEKNVGQAAVGEGQAGKALAELGLSAADLIGLSPDEAFVKIAESVSACGNRFQRARLEVELFGRSGAAMDQTLKAAAGGFDKYGTMTANVAASEQAAKYGASLALCWRDIKNYGIEFVGALQTDADWMKGENPFSDKALDAKAQDEWSRKHHPGQDDTDRIGAAQEHGHKLIEEAEKLLPKEDKETPLQKIDAMIEELNKAGDPLGVATEKLKQFRKEIVDFDVKKQRIKEEEAQEKTAKDAMKMRADVERDKMRASGMTPFQIKMRDAVSEGTLSQHEADSLQGDEDKIERQKTRQKIADQEKEKRHKLDEMAKRFEEGIKDRELGRQGETTAERDVRHLAEQGLDRKTAGKLLQDSALDEAQDEVGKRLSRGNPMAANMSFGSSAAYDAMASARTQSGLGDRQQQTQQAMVQHLAGIKDLLAKIYGKETPAVADNP